MPDVQDPGIGARLTFAADPLSVRTALAQLMGTPPLAGVASDDRATVELILAEVLNNIAEHAYAGSPGPVEVLLSRQTVGVRVRVIDQGGPMTGPWLRSGAPPDPIDLPEGGFGWSMIRKLASDLTYCRSEGCNRLGFLIAFRG